MKKVIIFFLFFVFLLSIISAVSIDSEIQKITYFAEEYETGNLNYVQLLVKISSVRQNLNKLLGAINFEGGILKQEQLKSFLGKPQEETKWVWIEGEEHEKKLDYYVPVWNKIIFDGKKIQIRLDAYPSMLKPRFIDDVNLDFKENEIVYRLHFQIEFKRPEEQLNVQSKINEIKLLAEIFNEDPSRSNAETLAKESVNAEMIFEQFFKQGQGNCEDLMKSIFGSENQRQMQKILLNEIIFFEGDNFEVIIRLEMCDECEWNWVHLDMHLEGRGNFRHPKEQGEKDLKNRFENMNLLSFEAEAEKLLNEIKKLLEIGNYNQAMSYSSQLQMLNEAWNKKANDIWDQVKEERTEMTFDEIKDFKEDQGELEQADPYYWIKKDQGERQKVNELRKQNYITRKQFYLNYFAQYDKKEYYFEQTDFEKRLIEEFKVKGKEICNNNKDDNNNEQVDCADDQCGGKICGKGTNTLENNNETTTIEVDFYCINKICQARELEKPTETICGNHICEEGEEKTCVEDCAICFEHAAIECEGNVIFSGKDERGCPLNPICIEETMTCEIDDDCQNPLCGNAECVDSLCQVTELEECKEAECEEGQEKIKQCGTEELVSAICINGLWNKISIDCGGLEKEIIEEIVVEEIVGGECVARSDCGGENDVCSNGKCVTIPQVVDVVDEEGDGPTGEADEIVEDEVVDEVSEPESEPVPDLEPIKEPEEVEEIPEEKPKEVVEQEESAPEPEPVSEPESVITGEIIFKLPAYLIMKLTSAITGSIVDGEGETTSEPAPEPEPVSEPTQPEEPVPKEIIDSPDKSPEEYPKDFEDHEDDNWEVKRDEEQKDDDRGDWERQDEEDRERHEEEQRRRCEKECVRPCVEKCIRESCGEHLDCDIDKESKNCEGECSADEDCIKKCMSGEEDWWQEFQEEHKEEKGVFQVGGGCRKEKGRTAGHIWFGGWGDPFEEIESLKHKYYDRGGGDWCKYDLENLIQQRKEFEKGFNQEFVTWFFEKYLPNSAENWEGAMSGIYELYWNDVDNSRQMAERMQCLGLEQLPPYNLINVKYETEYGSLEFWEEIKIVKLPEMEKKVEIITPYMKVWVFPPKEFIIYEMKNSMKNHEFPGPPEEKLKRENQGGPTEEEKEMIKQDKGFMKKIKKITDKYNGNVNVVIQFKDYTTEEVVFNLFVKINEEDIMTMEPMLPEEVPEYDVKIEMNFEPIYEMILSSEKDMQGTHIESPPWDRKAQPIQRVKEVTNGIKMYFKVRSLMNSAKVTPESAEDDAMDLFKEFFGMIGKDDRDREDEFSEDNKQKEIESDIFGQSK